MLLQNDLGTLIYTKKSAGRKYSRVCLHFAAPPKTVPSAVCPNHAKRYMFVITTLLSSLFLFFLQNIAQRKYIHSPL
jgi:hypothetical protein